MGDYDIAPTSAFQSGGMGVGIGSSVLGSGMRGSDITDGNPNAILGCVKTVAGVAGSATGPIGGMAAAGIGIVCDSIGDGIGAWDTQKTVAALKAALTKLPATASGEADELKGIISYAIGKKTSLRDRKIASATVVAKVGVQAFNASKFVFKKVKGTQGVHRSEFATRLQYLANSGSTQLVKDVAKEVIIALTRMNMDQIVKQSLQESLRSS